MSVYDTNSSQLLSYQRNAPAAFRWSNDIKVNTASLTPSGWQSQPATLSIFHAEQNCQLGARGLREILVRLPIVAFGVGEPGVTSFLFRGQWACEGKVLLMIC